MLFSGVMGRRNGEPRPGEGDLRGPIMDVAQPPAGLSSLAADLEAGFDVVDLGSPAPGQEGSPAPWHKLVEHLGPSFRIGLLALGLAIGVSGTASAPHSATAALQSLGTASLAAAAHQMLPDDGAGPSGGGGASVQDAQRGTTDTASPMTTAAVQKAVAVHLDPVLASKHTVLQAAETTGAPLSFMLVTAGVESDWKASVKAKTSSATGLYQFTEQGWLSTLYFHGKKHGLDSTVDKLREGKLGGYTTKNKADLKAVLALRNDPRLNALMAAELTNENRGILQSKLGRTPSNVETYYAHFLGAPRAAEFLAQLKRSPNARPGEMAQFAEAARANKPVFFDKETGKARTFAEINRHFNEKFADADNTARAIKAEVHQAVFGGGSAPGTAAPAAVAQAEPAKMPSINLSNWRMGRPVPAKADLVAMAAP